jgi:hypothetical protein
MISCLEGKKKEKKKEEKAERRRKPCPESAQ